MATSPQVKKHPPSPFAEGDGVRISDLVKAEPPRIIKARTKRDVLEEAIGNDLNPARIDPQLLCVDRMHYQRREDQDHVDWLMTVIRTNPDSEDARSDAIVGVREDRTHWLLNAQHHNAAAMRLKIPEIEIVWFLSKGHKFERKLFERFNAWQESVR